LFSTNNGGTSKIVIFVQRCLKGNLWLLFHDISTNIFVVQENILEQISAVNLIAQNRNNKQCCICILDFAV